MSSTQAILLGIIQGLTEFLPVSSSAHLVFFERLVEINNSVLFLLALHIGTLIAIVLVYRVDILAQLRFLFYDGWRHGARGNRTLLGHWRESEEGWMIVLVIVASIPTAVIGLVFKKFFESGYDNPVETSIELIITGGLLMLSRVGRPGADRITAMPLWVAVAIGVAQGLAILPGISRSGATICAALLLGTGRATAGKFSFLMSIPAILGAFVLEFEGNFEMTMIDPMILGVVISFITGYLSLKMLLGFIAQGRLHWWAWYCWVVGTIALIYFGVLSEELHNTVAERLQDLL